MILIVGTLLVAELVPAPRPLASAEIPSIYEVIAADPRTNVRVLELPFGISDGTRTIGKTSSLKQFYQTAHGKPIVGGYISRVSARRFADIDNDPVLGVLIRLNEAQPLPSERITMFERNWHDFVKRFDIGYVVLDADRASADLRHVVTNHMNLEEIARDGPVELYRPRTL